MVTKLNPYQDETDENSELYDENFPYKWFIKSKGKEETKQLNIYQFPLEKAYIQCFSSKIENKTDFDYWLNKNRFQVLQALILKPVFNLL